MNNKYDCREEKKTASGTDISVVIPVFNEEENLEELISRCMKTCIGLDKKFEIILVDDGSTDSSPEIIGRASEDHPGQIIGVFLNRNYGQHAAVMAGFRESRGDIIVTLDADLQNPPEEIPRLVEAARQGYDVVGTVRKEREDSIFRRISSAIINKAVQKSTGVMMHDYGCMLRAYRRHIVDTVLECDERSTFIPILANSYAHTTTEIEVRHEARRGGVTKYSFSKLINLMFDLFTSMTTFPLRLLSIIGAAIAFLGIGFGLFLLLMRIIMGSAWAGEGVFTLFAILFIFIGAQFMGMGLLGEYIGRIYNNVRSRPFFLIKSVSGRNINKGN